MKNLRIKLRAIISAVALAAALPCVISPAFANSGKRYEYGILGPGLLEQKPASEQSALAVESEKLTFDIVDFPAYPNVDGYKSTVTAEYTFVNTGDTAVRTSMAFPIGVDRACEGEATPPQIKVNGEKIAVETRHTYGSYNDFEFDVAKISDDLTEDSFYKPDLPVTCFLLTSDLKSKEEIRCIGKYSADKDKVRLISHNSSDTEMFYWLDGKDPKDTSGVDMYNMYAVTYFLLGDPSAFECEWKAQKFVSRPIFTSCFSSSGYYKDVGNKIEVKELGRTTLGELLLHNRSAESVVSERDWYNGLLLRLLENQSGVRAGSVGEVLSCREDDFLEWYTYDVEVPAGGKITNSVTAAIFPVEHAGTNPYIYEYEYYLSPAKTWKSFGTLEVQVNTTAFMQDISDGFVKNAQGYAAKFDKLPEGELRFSLCGEEHPVSKPVKVSAGFVIVIIIILFFVVSFVGGIIFLIVFAVKSSVKNSKNGKDNQTPKQ